MINYPDSIWTKPQLIDHLEQLAYFFKSRVFLPSVPFTFQNQIDWIELIRGVSDLLRQTAMAGNRICFTDEVNDQDQQQDITSLLDKMRQMAYVVKSTALDHEQLTIISPTFNQVIGVGSGYFANGLYFACPYPNERAFFIGRDRVYFYRHLMRAYLEAGQFLLSEQI
ncbi:hypothetical protein [Spirosoma terrae]|uniref:Uncharacterized protein n=1 Tax=Spirosoma terrae TaxID=1968276 RepID=A0A6L9LFG5_9BACT|nr:hypothetical protein [Spirosoma terrae]NDU95409.1 hypothetical protein [Spirosoma terrae]